MTLNPADSRPLYQQLAATLRAEINSGDLAPGDRVPTEAELSERYSTSRNTVRLALNLLRNEGLLTSQQGRGTFVRTNPPVRYHASLTGLRSKRLEAQRQREPSDSRSRSRARPPARTAPLTSSQPMPRWPPALTWKKGTGSRFEAGCSTPTVNRCNWVTATTRWLSCRAARSWTRQMSSRGPTRCLKTSAMSRLGTGTRSLGACQRPMKPRSFISLQVRLSDAWCVSLSTSMKPPSRSTW